MRATELGLTCAMTTGGTVLVNLTGELDIASAGSAFDRVRQIIDRYHGRIVVDLSGVTFCDARGLGALMRMSNYALRARCPFEVASPRPHLLKIMRITGVDRRLCRGARPHDAMETAAAGSGRPLIIARR